MYSIWRNSSPNFLSQILQAVARKMTVSPTVNFDNLADRTDGFSGADLQALLYNAHLEVVHSSIAEFSPTSTSTTYSSSNVIDEQPIQYFNIGANAGKTVLSKAEEMAMQKRLRRIQEASTRPSVSTTSAAAPHRVCFFLYPLTLPLLTSWVPATCHHTRLYRACVKSHQAVGLSRGTT